jgi:hypothetical protein
MAGYGTDEGFAAFLTDNGYTLPDDAPAPAVLRQRGSNYLDAAYEPMLYCSVRAGGFDQERAWPRTGHLVGGISVDGVPLAWINASYRAAWLEASQPGWASGSINPNRITKREKVQSIEREFFAPSDTGSGASGSAGNVDAAIQGMVSVFFCVSVDGVGIWSVGR